MPRPTASIDAEPSSLRFEGKACQSARKSGGAQRAETSEAGKTPPETVREEVNDDDEDQEEQLTICHISPGNPSARQNMVIGAPGWPAHEAHGGTLGPCASSPDRCNVEANLFSV